MLIANLFIKRTFASLPKRSIEKVSPGCILVRATLRNNAANFKFEKFATLHSERSEIERERRRRTVHSHQESLSRWWWWWWCALYRLNSGGTTSSVAGPEPAETNYFEDRSRSQKYAFNKYLLY